MKINTVMVINIQNISMMSYLKGFIRKVSHHCLLVTVVTVNRGKIDTPNTQINDWFETATRGNIDTPNTHIHDWFETATRGKIILLLD
jgi:hypothetical protein